MSWSGAPLSAQAGGLARSAQLESRSGMRAQPYNRCVKNVEILERKGPPSFRVPVQGLVLRGWAIKYVSGMEEMPEVRPGFWMSQWRIDREAANFNFDSELHMAFGDEAEANEITRFLREIAGIETEVVKIR